MEDAYEDPGTPPEEPPGGHKFDVIDSVFNSKQITLDMSYSPEEPDPQVITQPKKAYYGGYNRQRNSHIYLLKALYLEASNMYEVVYIESTGLLNKDLLSELAYLPFRYQVRKITKGTLKAKIVYTMMSLEYTQNPKGIATRLIESRYL